MKTPLTSKKDAISFCIINSACLINIFVQVPCYRCAVFAHMLHFCENCRSVFIWQCQQEIFYRPCSILSLIVAPLPFMI